MTHRQHEAGANKLAARFGRSVPDIISNPPVLFTHLTFGWRAFWDLRKGTDDVMAIKWVDVQFWCNTYRLDYVEAENIHSIITTLDSTFIPIMVKRRKDAQDKADAEAKRAANSKHRGS